MSLLELLTVIIIIGILATVAISSHHGVVQATVNTKARHALSLIAQAEKAVHSETGAYEANIATLEADSGVDLSSVVSDTDWSYAVAGSVATATKLGAPNVGGTITLDFDTNVFTETSV